MIICIVEEETNKEIEQDGIVTRNWLKNKWKLIDDVTRKAKRGDYSGAEETIKILEKLNQIVEDDR